MGWDASCNGKKIIGRVKKVPLSIPHTHTHTYRHTKAQNNNKHPQNALKRNPSRSSLPASSTNIHPLRWNVAMRGESFLRSNQCNADCRYRRIVSFCVHSQLVNSSVRLPLCHKKGKVFLFVCSWVCVCVRVGVCESARCGENDEYKTKITNRKKDNNSPFFAWNTFLILILFLCRFYLALFFIFNRLKWERARDNTLTCPHSLFAHTLTHTYSQTFSLFLCHSLSSRRMGQL